MTEDIDRQDSQDENEEESFAELFETYGAGMRDNIEVGDKISGKILSVGTTHIFVDTGTKIDGVVDREELLDDEGQLPYAEGDTLELYVVSMSESELKLSRAISGIGGLSMIKEAFANHVPVEGKVQKSIKGGFEVEVVRRRAFCPVSQMDVKYVDNPDEYVGNTYHFLIKQFEEKGRNIVLSRRTILEKEQQVAKQAFLEGLCVDDVVDGSVTRLMPYGAFVELTPGLEGMVHISELSWSRVEKPEEAVKAGDMVRVQVLAIEDGKKPHEKRIALSIKKALGDPWGSLTDRLHVGDRVKGKVTRLMGFGAFVEIFPGVEGLVHISEMSYLKRVNKPEEVVTAGESVWVMVKEIDLQSRRISLSIKAAEGDPWANIDEKYPIGQPAKGVFEKKEKFGCFIALEPGVVGLLPRSKISRSSSAAAIEKLKNGDAVTVVVEEIQADLRKISLGVADTVDEGDWKNYSANTGSAMGSLGEMLQQAMKNNSKK